MVFNGQIWDALQLLNIIKCRYAYWFNAKWSESGLSIDDVLRGYDSNIEVNHKGSNRVVMEWSPPREGVIKFNVDGTANGKPGPAGIGGILRDSRGAVIAIFSMSVGVRDSNEAGFLAMREAFRMVPNSRWVSSKVIFESDSKNAILWTNAPSKIPWKLRYESNHLCNLKQEIGDGSVFILSEKPTKKRIRWLSRG